MALWHAFASAYLDDQYVYWEAVKDRYGYRKIHNPTPNLQIAFARFLDDIGTTVIVPAGTLAYYRIATWGVTGTARLNGASESGVNYGSSADRAALLALADDADFRDFMRLTAPVVDGGSGSGDSVVAMSETSEAEVATPGCPRPAPTISTGLTASPAPPATAARRGSTQTAAAI
jgi:hypothetical protein